jgi:predicted neuraminidase
VTRVAVAGIVLAAGPLLALTPPPIVAVVRSEFIDERPPYPSAHASTVVETPSGLVAAWFGGTGEGRADVGIWLSRHDGKTWSTPIEVATGVVEGGARHPCWNPVLFQPADGPLLLFYKVGPSPREWWGLVRTSADRGRTWSSAIALPAGILGPIRAKPVALDTGELLAGSSTEHAGWVVHMERFLGPFSALGSGSAWSRSGPLNSPEEFGAIQPTILMHSASRVQILCRSRQGVVTEAWSDDRGRSWSPMKATTLPNPSAGIDSVRLRDGRFLLVSNPTTSGRGKLEVAVSADGVSWRPAVVLEDTALGEFSYPAMIQTRDGLVHVTYTWQRSRIRHVAIDPAQIR